MNIVCNFAANIIKIIHENIYDTGTLIFVQNKIVAQEAKKNVYTGYDSNRVVRRASPWRGRNESGGCFNPDYANYTNFFRDNQRNQRFVEEENGHAKARPYTFHHTMMKKSLTPRERT